MNGVAQDNEALSAQIRTMIKEKDPEKNVALMKKTIMDFNLDPIENSEDIDCLKGVVALSFLEAGAFNKFEFYIGEINNKFNQTSYMNMGAEKLFRSDSNLNYAESLAKKTVELYVSYKDDPSARPASYAVEDWDRFMRMSVYPYYEAYAQILFANGKNEQACFYEDIALKDLDIEETSQSSIEFYTTLLESVGHEDKAYTILLRMATLGKSSLGMDLLLKKLCVKKMGSEENAVCFLDSIQKNSAKAYVLETEKKMISNLDAPDFTLLDTEGRPVTLSSLRGKVVVIDFWATWCAPCISSMPAMKKVCGLHPEVVFLFVATGEKGTDEQSEARVKTFSKKRELPGIILVDKHTDQKTFTVADAYKVEELPTKIVIDRQGEIRFLVKGFSTDSEAINELEAMIAIAKEQ